ncbi:helix-turn-helix transcriptional regulator [Mesorhizobium sp. CA4]|uniref:helix-turn-helix transcriptional regulator n=1 Tax=Mesorhizobium sp. CA4 TaxID=588499 RepID=UPI001CD14027|nr:AraC family transcriptional regulator [Mesorhizobium sp. CA4]MBZ9823214.1 AraC family transcriptional regulator [Mesorhizobium sp. CA4]
MTSSECDLDDDPHLAVAGLESVLSMAEGRAITTGWGAAAYSLLPPGSYTFPAGHHVVYTGLDSAPGTFLRLGQGKAERYDAPAGGIIVKPAHLEARLNLSEARESAIVVYPDSSLKELARQQFGTEQVELKPPPLGTLDHTALRVGQLLKAELAKEQRAPELHVEHLIAILGVHILHAYTSPDKEPQQLKGGLTRKAARTLEHFIRANFARKISVDELATLANLSPNHFIQAFSRTFGKSPHRYLLDLRLDHATRLLSEGDATITDVAYLSGFSSQSHLTAAMKKHRGTTPTRFRSAI